MKSNIIILTVLLLISRGHIAAQVTTDVPYKSPVMGALMGSNVAMSSGASSALSNPATLSTLEDAFFMAGTQKIFNQSFLPHHTFSGGVRLPRHMGYLGINLESMSVSYGDRSLTGETAVGISHGFNLREDRISSLNAGYTLKYMSVDYGQSAGLSGTGEDGLDLGNAQAFGLDVGFQATLSKRHWMGVIVHNLNRPQIGSGSNVSMLPRDIQAGFSYAPTQQVITSFSLVNRAAEQTEFHAGLEYALNENLVLRSGIQSNPNRFGAGFSFRAKGFCLDYALLTHPILPATHQFSLGYSLANPF